jgi:hypothetical protein
MKPPNDRLPKNKHIFHFYYRVVSLVEKHGTYNKHSFANPSPYSEKR